MISRHLSRCFVAGLVALLPVGGLVLGVALLESAIARSWMAGQPWYFPGLGLVAVSLAVYLIGLLVTSFLGRWMWARVDALLDVLPAVGKLYQTLKQILGYGEGADALFQEVVFVPSRDRRGEELGLVTRRVARPGPGGDLLAIFVPGAPNPTLGRLVFVSASEVRPAGVAANDAFTALLALGKTELDVSAAASPTAAGATRDAEAGPGRGGGR